MNLFFKFFIHRCYFIAVSISLSLKVAGQSDSKLFWQTPDDHQSFKLQKGTERFSGLSRKLTLDMKFMRSFLQTAPKQDSTCPENEWPVIQLPMPDGSWESFRVIESRVMHPDLAAAYPFIKTYSARGIDDPNSIARLDITQWGFHSMILSPKGNTFIEPAVLGNTADYVCYDKKNNPRIDFFSCNADHPSITETDKAIQSEMKSAGTQLRTYRLALACTGEYAAFYGGTKAGALSGMVTTINRCNGVFESEVSIRLMLIPNDTLIIYTEANSDPYTNENVSVMLTENQNHLNSVIGNSNFDVGHVFGTGSGGIAALASVCSSSGKAKGVTGSVAPVGDAFDIDYVSHEFGHQFGARHTFNSVTGSCGGGNRNGQTAYEPGSGITIMAYAGICGTDNIDLLSIPYFHTISFDEITNFITTGTGNTCPVINATGNDAPFVTSMGLSYSIPISTPFVLSGTATDPNNDSLTYSWEEFDLGPGGSWNTQSSTAPLLRSFAPSNSPARTFPQLSDLLNHSVSAGELLPNMTRVLKFRLTVRDNRPGGGGVMHPDTTLKITVVNNGGAFSVTSPNTAITWGTGTSQIVSWNVSGTTNAPINCTHVKISLSVDGGISFPIVLSSTTPNDGSEIITIPDTPTTQARIKVESAGNIFFDMSDYNFIINASSGTLSVITINKLTDKYYCAGEALELSFVADAPANPGNVYNVQLSDPAGSFSNPVILGTIESMNSGSISVTIPANAEPGTNYRIRVVSSDPIISAEPDTGISIFGIPHPAGIIHGPAEVCQGESGVVFSVDSILYATSYVWSLSPGAEIVNGAASNSITVDFSEQASAGNIIAEGTNAACNGISSTGFFVSIKPLPSAALCIEGPEVVCQNETEVSFSVQEVNEATGYSWTLPEGVEISSGVNTNSITTYFSAEAFSGVVSVAGTNECGIGAAASDLDVSVNPTPFVAIHTDSNTTICAGTVVQLNCIAEPGITYQWRKNGNAIAGAITPSFEANETGFYDLLASSSTLNAQTFSNCQLHLIPDHSCTNAVADSILVSGYSNTIEPSSIKVKVNIIHPWIGDLDIILEAPNGNRLGLSHRAGSSNNSGDNYTNTVFSDLGSAEIPISGAPYTGTYKPWHSNFISCTTTTHSSFASIGGGLINPNGIWKLLVYDRAAQDTGQIRNWSITLPATSPKTCTTASNKIEVVVTDTPSIKGLTPSSGMIGGTFSIHGHNLNTVTSVMINGTGAFFEIFNDTQIEATIPATATSGYVSVSNPCTTVFSTEPFEVQVTNASLILNVFLECYYLGNGIMYAVIDPAGHPDICDSITVDLRASFEPFPLVSSAKGTINLFGSGTFYFDSLACDSYFIVVRHRCSIETWSNQPVLFNAAIVNYNFTD